MNIIIGSLLVRLLAVLIMGKEPTVSVIIPCHYKHALLLPELLLRYESQTVLPNEVVIALSDSAKVAASLIAEIQRPRAFPIKLSLSREKRSAGENRNCACKIASGEVFLFQDADDFPHPQRVEIVRHFFQKYRIDHLMHAYCCAEGEVFKTYDVINSPHQITNTYEEIEPLSVTHGNPAISRKLFQHVHWRSMGHAGEDVLFTQAAYRQSPRHIVVTLPLLTYRNELSSFRK